MSDVDRRAWEELENALRTALNRLEVAHTHGAALSVSIGNRLARIIKSVSNMHDAVGVQLREQFNDQNLG